MRWSRSSGRTARRKPWTSRAVGQTVADASHDIGLTLGVRQEAQAGRLLLLQNAVHGFARGADQVHAGEPRLQGLEDPLLGFLAVAPPPPRSAVSTPRKARVGRIGQSRLMASSFSRTRSLMNLPAACLTSTRTLPEQIRSIWEGVTPRASPLM